MIPSQLNIVSNIQYWDLLTYLTYTGWDLIDDTSNQFIIFSGPKDNENNPLEIVFLKNPDANEQSLYISNAIEILSSLGNLEPSYLIHDIININRDCLKIRVSGIDTLDAIPLRTAAVQINELKQLVAYAARGEVDQKPFYLNAQHPNAKSMVDSYRFGHTFKGSFGFTIETPKFLDIYSIKQLSILPQLVEDKNYYPLWRKVMERIVRGLINVQEATSQKDPAIIINNYKVGLNANMCQALADMLVQKTLTIEYSIRWAAVKLPDDPLIHNPKPIQIGEPAYNQLTYAVNELTELQPEDVSVNGMVIELTAKDSPMALDTSRTIKIRWFEPAEGKTYEATATLNVEDYAAAINAHKNWNSVQITGTLSRYKHNWRFNKYTDFRII